VLHVWRLGDRVTGSIHPDDNVGQTWELPESIPNVAHIGSQQLVQLSAHFGEVHVAAVPGNHARSTLKPVFKRTAERNWDRAICRLEKMMCRNLPNVEFNITESLSTVVSVCGWDNYLTHGAEIPMNNRVPYYPIEATMQREAGMRRQARRWIEMAAPDVALPDVEFDFVWMEHYHHRAVLADSIYICPSQIGANQYSKSKIHSMSQPRQLLVFFTRKHGVTVERVINLSAATKHSFIDPAGI
jgi:hypothetical protein